MFAEVFQQAFFYLAAAVLAVPLAKRLGLGSALGYLLAGVVIGPNLLGLVGKEGQDVMHFAEFGVVLMLFLIGLELNPRELWRLRIPILGLGGLLKLYEVWGDDQAYGLRVRQNLEDLETVLRDDQESGREVVPNDGGDVSLRPVS